MAMLVASAVASWMYSTAKPWGWLYPSVADGSEWHCRRSARVRVAMCMLSVVLGHNTARPDRIPTRCRLHRPTDGARGGQARLGTGVRSAQHALEKIGRQIRAAVEPCLAVNGLRLLTDCAIARVAGPGDVLEPQSLERQVSHTAFSTRQAPASEFALDLHIHANSDGRYVLDPLQVFPASPLYFLRKLLQGLPQTVLTMPGREFLPAQSDQQRDN